MGVAAVLGQKPQAAVGQPTELVEVPVDPRWIGEAVTREQLRAGEVDRGQPAVLVVDRAHQHRGMTAVLAPVDRRAAAVAVGLDAHVAVALEWVLLGRLAQRRQRVGGDAGQRVHLEFAGFAIGQLDQPQLVRQRRVAADARAHLVEFLIPRFGDVFGHLAGGSGVAGLGLGDHQQPFRVGRQRAVDDLHVVAEIGRRRRAAGIAAAPLLVLLARGLALVAVVLERADHRQLAIAQVVGFRRFGRVFLGLDDRGLAHALAGAPLEPVVVDPEHEIALATPLRARLRGDAARDLGEGAVAQVAHEHVAVAHERHARALRIVSGLRGVDVGACGAIDPHRDAVGDRLLPDIADRRAFALERVLHTPSVPGPPRLLHRRPDPVGIGHRLIEGERGLRLCLRGGGKQ